MKNGDILLAKDRAKVLFFDLLVIELDYLEDRYARLGWIVKCHNN